MTGDHTSTLVEEPVPTGPSFGATPAPTGSRFFGMGSWLPTWGLISTKQLELRKRRGLMSVVVLLTVGLPVLVLGIRLLLHAVDEKSFGPAGSPGIFSGLANPIAEFSFIVAATLGTAAGTTDLTDGVFRHLVVTGRYTASLYLTRIPAGLSIILPLVAAAFTVLCLVTSYAGISQPTSVNENGISIPANLSEAQLKTWLLLHPNEAMQAIEAGPTKIGPGEGGPPQPTPSSVRSIIERNAANFYSIYQSDELTNRYPSINEMVKIGLWIELEVGIGFVVGLGLGSLTGQRTLSTILMIVLEIIITPILANNEIPYFLNGQRLVVGIAMDQLRPAGLAAGVARGGPGKVLFGGRGSLGIPPMPTWAMIAVIVGWIVGWSAIGVWRMITRDA